MLFFDLPGPVKLFPLSVLCAWNILSSDLHVAGPITSLGFLINVTHLASYFLSLKSVAHSYWLIFLIYVLDRPGYAKITKQPQISGVYHNKNLFLVLTKCLTEISSGSLPIASSEDPSLWRLHFITSFQDPFGMKVGTIQ